MVTLYLANVIGAFITFIKTYAGFGIIIVAALLLYLIIAIVDRAKKSKRP